jgi:hypothetical protein
VEVTPCHEGRQGVLTSLNVRGAAGSSVGMKTGLGDLVVRLHGENPSGAWAGDSILQQRDWASRGKRIPQRRMR